MSKRTNISVGHLILMLAIVCGGCGPDAESPPEAEDPQSTEEFGLPGGKGDAVDCDQTSPFCWSAEEQRLVQQVLVAEDDLMWVENPGPEHAAAYLDAIDELRHKLSETEVEALEELEQGPDVGSEDFVGQVRERVLQRVMSGYYTAHAVPLGQYDPDDPGKGDTAERSGLAAADGEFTPAMRENLATLRDKGLIGTIYAFMFEHTGVLSRTYAPHSVDWRGQPPVALRADDALRSSQWAQARSSAVANLESLIPFAGVAISVPHGMLMSFKVRARLVLELAATYGLDIREGQNLLLAAAALMSVNELTEIRALLGASVAAPFLVKRVATRFGVEHVDDLVRFGILRALDYVWPAASRLGRRIMQRVGLEAAAEGAARQVASYATFGLAMVADIVLSVMAVERAGKSVKTVMHPWGSNMLVDHAPTTKTRDGRDCATILLADAAGIDGTWSSDEIELLTAHIGRAVWHEDAWRRLNSVEEMGRQARRAVDHQASDSIPSCVSEEFRGIGGEERLTILSWYRTTLALDAHLSDSELVRYDQLLEELDGDAWFGDGRALDEMDLGAMESRVDTVFVDPSSVLGEGTLTEDQRLRPRDVITRLDEAYPEAELALECAMNPGC